jgi:two-component system chemotaxis response regulator CheB
MPVSVLLADDSDVMLKAMRKFLEEDLRIEVVGEASTFAETMQMIADCKPDVLLLDLHIPEARGFTPAFVRSQLVSVDCSTIAVSFSNDSEAKALAESYGASSLLDKMNLYSEMIPAILRCAKRTIPQGALPNRYRVKKIFYRPIKGTKGAVSKHAA